MLFQLCINCAACYAGNRGIIEPYELGTYDGLDVKVWDWGPDVARCASASAGSLTVHCPACCPWRPLHRACSCPTINHSLQSYAAVA